MVANFINNIRTADIRSIDRTRTWNRVLRADNRIRKVFPTAVIHHEPSSNKIAPSVRLPSRQRASASIDLLYRPCRLSGDQIPIKKKENKKKLYLPPSLKLPTDGSLIGVAATAAFDEPNVSDVEMRTGKNLTTNQLLVVVLLQPPPPTTAAVAAAADAGEVDDDDRQRSAGRLRIFDGRKAPTNRTPSLFRSDESIGTRRRRQTNVIAKQTLKEFSSGCAPPRRRLLG